MLCIANRRSNGTTRPDPRGTVYDRAGHVLGRVTSTTRRLRGTGGQSGRAFSALVIFDGRECGYLGTRYPDRWAAARALAAFHRYIGSGDNLGPFERPWDARYVVRGTHAEAVQRAAVARATAYFKYDHHETCCLTARYRGADPRIEDEKARERHELRTAEAVAGLTRGMATA